MIDYSLILSQKLSLIFTKISTLYLAKKNDPQLRTDMINLLSNKKNKFPWSIDEVQVALDNVLQNFY